MSNDKSKDLGGGGRDWRQSAGSASMNEKWLTFGNSTNITFRVTNFIVKYSRYLQIFLTVCYMYVTLMVHSKTKPLQEVVTMCTLLSLCYQILTLKDVKGKI